FQAAGATLNLAISYANRYAGFAGKVAKENPKLKRDFATIQNAFRGISISLKSAKHELKDSPDFANYDVMVCTDGTTMMKKLIGKNTDKVSKTVMLMTLKMEELIAMAVGATLAVGG
ncbi:hypothetical protein CARUB_v10027394mg, partial [Capsella rubella]